MVGSGTKASLALFVAFLGAFYQLYVRDVLALVGIFPNRVVDNIGNEGCEVVKELQACEKISIHQPTGILYLACGTQQTRRLWTPYFDLLNPAGAGSDYIAQYNPTTKQITRMTFVGPPSSSKSFFSKSDSEPFKYSAHGMDVVPSSNNPDELFFYLVNHRAPPPDAGAASKIGADSVVEIFKSVVPGKGKSGESEKLVWVETFKSEHLHTPNDVLGSPDGKSFYWTNDHGRPVSWKRTLEGPLKIHATSVGHCHSESSSPQKCHIAISGLLGSNGITGNGNGTVYVASTTGYVQVLHEELADSAGGKDGKGSEKEGKKKETGGLKKLSMGEKIPTGIGLDNLSMDKDGVVWAGGFPKVLPFLQTFFGSSEALESNIKKSPSIALKVVTNTDRESFFGKRWSVETVFQNDGSLMTSATSVAVDSERGYLYMHGILSPHLLVCKLKK